jgi:hypothetical protein
MREDSGVMPIGRLKERSIGHNHQRGQGICRAWRYVVATIQRKKHLTPPVEPKITGEVEARLIALECSTSPPGHARWSLRQLESHAALIEDIPDMDHSTIGRVLKTALRPHLKKC